jgi:hypothetical protein
MKKFLLYVLMVLLKSFPGYSQGIINDTGPINNESIQQVLLPGIDELLIFRDLNQTVGNSVMTLQTGNGNSADIQQQNGSNSDRSNQAYIVQSGNSNELTLGQMGNGNLLLGYQLDLQGVLPGDRQIILGGTAVPVNIQTEILHPENDNIVLGERNKMNITQQGNNNGVMAVQQGSDNVITAVQSGDNNYLLAFQKGYNNSVNGYTQENVSEQILFDRIIQVGDNLSLKSEEASKSSLKGNTIMQTGSHLALELNSDLINSAGGIDIHQTGKDMKVPIDQSYFSFPMK